MAKKICILVYSFLCLNTLRITAQYSVLLNFDYTNGAEPYGALTLSGSRLYGMTSLGGIPGYSGNIFSIDTNGSDYKDLLDFNGTDGQQPMGSLSLSGGRLYGMTMMGGTGVGNIFSIDTNGNGFKDLFNFNTANNYPEGSLTVLGNMLYGMTLGGGAHGYGCIFSIDTNGNGYKDIFDFNGGTNGGSPTGSLTVSVNKLYGMTEYGGINDSGCIFSIDTNGSNYKKLLDFNGTNGKWPTANLTLSGRTLYGMANAGGAEGDGCIFSIDTNGTGYKDLFDFSGTNGKNPAFSSLTLVGSMFYGTAGGGINDDGVIFCIDTNGDGFMDLFDFNDTSGEYPTGLTNSKNTLYGMTQIGGTGAEGVIFDFTEIGLGIDKLTSTESSINLYPNPNNGRFTMALQNVKQSAQIEIYNMLGQSIYQIKLNSRNTEINLSNQPAGVYLYRVITENGEYISSGKVVIE